MIIGTVINTLNTKRRSPQFAGRELLLVKSMEALTPALDLVGAAVGDRVVLVSGDAARYLSADCPTDTAVVAILDTEAIE